MECVSRSEKCVMAGAADLEAEHNPGAHLRQPVTCEFFPREVAYTL